MTNAEFKTLRESLGLSTKWVAQQLGTDDRTVRYWEVGGKLAVPNYAAELLIKIDHGFNQQVINALKTVEQGMANTDGELEDIVLLRYRSDEDLWHFLPELKPLPATAHAAMLGRIRSKLFEAGISNLIQYMDKDNYLLWLKGREDGSALRAEWAATQ